MNADELRELAELVQDNDLAKHGRRQVADYLRACADAREKGPVAWMHEDGRVVPRATMQSAVRDGGAMLSSLAGYTIPLYPVAMPGALRLPEPMTLEELNKLPEAQHWWGWSDAVAAAKLARAVEAETLRRVKEANE